MQKVVFQSVKGHVLHRNLMPFTGQKTAFYYANNILLYDNYTYSHVPTAKNHKYEAHFSIY